jgi:monooxygenase
MEHETVDVVIVGAGLAGVGTAARLRSEHPELSLTVLEARDAVGGTWDLFRYPGVRSDSDMYTLGYPFRPWRDERSIAPAAAIRDYIRESADEFGVTPLIRFRHRVTGAGWDSGSARWTVELTDALGSAKTITCSFLVLCAGYYSYDRGYTPELPGLAAFQGTVVHPQTWPEDLDVAGRRVVVVGSGATAVTLVPALVERGAQVTMLQRSPTYVAAVPRRDRFAARVDGVLPAGLAYRATRWRSLAKSLALYQYSRRRPDAMRALLQRNARAKLPAGFDVDTHFSPRYAPWDQRLCAVPGGDLFRAISSGSADVVTDRIETLTETGVDLESGAHLPADVLVTATGLVLQPLGGIRLSVDGDVVDPATRIAYRGMMLSGVPNLAFAMGYVNASWTLKTDLMALHVSRLLTHLRRHRLDSVTSTVPVEGTPTLPFLELASGYVQRGIHLMPKQAAAEPWRVNQNYLRDVVQFRWAPLRRGLRFGRATAEPRARVLESSRKAGGHAPRS